MSEVPDGLYYTKEHEWMRVEGDPVTIGITDHAQDMLTDIVYIELPEEGKLQQSEYEPAARAVAVRKILWPDYRHKSGGG